MLPGLIKQGLQCPRQLLISSPCPSPHFCLSFCFWVPLPHSFAVVSISYFSCFLLLGLWLILPFPFLLLILSHLLFLQLLVVLFPLSLLYFLLSPASFSHIPVSLLLPAPYTLLCYSCFCFCIPSTTDFYFLLCVPLYLCPHPLHWSSVSLYPISHSPSCFHQGLMKTCHIGLGLNRL